MSSARAHTNAGAWLEIRLDAVCANWRLLRQQAEGAVCGAVVKADAYGLGAARVAPALYRAGCRHFFVAHLDEGIALRPLLDTDAILYVMHGPPPGSEPEFVAHGLVPVLNSLPQLDAWQRLAHALGRELPAVLQVDTGMARMGLPADELEAVANDEGRLRGLALQVVMSHLVSAEDPAAPINARQLERFRSALARLPRARASLANSSGIFLGPEYRFDLVRPGAALYGVAPVAGAANPMRPVVRLRSKVIQLRRIETGTGVGYGHAWVASRPSRIATLATGYADGWLRSFGNRGEVEFEGRRLPVVGRVSMDAITVDATDVPEGQLAEGALVDLLGDSIGVDDAARAAGTIGYEILTSLGGRYARSYLGA
ncbi:alanine racemase [Schlegelella sp. S2-27]|uniref:Alanine racemase n=1 Tax=Caldimonas mangrovi TaxID=2944811 RepID=A0ABT0YVJ1_9BURK|nr:alanine racemase [Caldimonas mangrovi]MCM5681828.1 alanine racemase [Caldimonas mangrovi]